MNSGKRYKGYDTIKLLDDITLTSTLVLESANLTDITIDLNGHILQSDGGKFTMLEVQDGVTLTIIDSNPTKDNGPDIPFTGGSIRGAVKSEAQSSWRAVPRLTSTPARSTIVQPPEVLPYIWS